MFSLVITLIAIALVAALALSAIFYGGDAWRNGQASARATRLSVETEQLQSAVQLFRQEEGRLPTTMNELTDEGKYLSSAPSGEWSSNVSFMHTTSSSVDAETCLLFNKRRAIPFVPQCTDEFYKNVIVCCQTDPDPNA